MVLCIKSIKLSIFSIWKTLQVLQKTGIKIMVHAICTYLFFSYPYTLIFCWKTIVVIAVFISKLRLQATSQWYILQDYSSMRISFSMTNKHHILPVVYTILVKTCYVFVITVLLRVKRSIWQLCIDLISILSFPKQWIADYRCIFRTMTSI